MSDKKLLRKSGNRERNLVVPELFHTDFREGTFEEPECKPNGIKPGGLFDHPKNGNSFFTD